MIQLAAAAGDKGKSLLIIMRLRDSGLLKDTQKWGMYSITIIHCPTCPPPPPPHTGRLVESVADWQKALETMSEVYGPVTGHVTGHVREGELTMSELVHVMVERVGPTLATHILASVGGAGGVASGEAGAELHSLLVQLAALHAQQRCMRQLLVCSVRGSPAVLSLSLSGGLPGAFWRRWIGIYGLASQWLCALSCRR